jgi:adenosylmethionine-8-amino-7-oxononanoate aminotransferase
VRGLWAPPFIISQSEVEQLADILDKSLGEAMDAVG